MALFHHILQYCLLAHSMYSEQLSLCLYFWVLLSAVSMSSLGQLYQTFTFSVSVCVNVLSSCRAFITCIFSEVLASNSNQ